MTLAAIARALAAVPNAASGPVPPGATPDWTKALAGAVGSDGPAPSLPAGLLVPGGQASLGDVAQGRPTQAGQGAPKIWDYVRYEQSETLTPRAAEAAGRALGVPLTGPFATINYVDPGEDPAQIKPPMAPANRDAILRYNGVSIIDDELSSAWVNREPTVRDGKAYGVDAQTAVDYVASQEAAQAYLQVTYDGANGSPRISIQDVDTKGEEASSYVSERMATARILEVITGVMEPPRSYDGLVKIGNDAVRDVVAKYDLKTADGAPVNIQDDILTPMGDRLASVIPAEPGGKPSEDPSLPRNSTEALAQFGESHLSKLKGSNGFTPQAFVADLEVAIIEGLRAEGARISERLKAGIDSPSN